MLEATPMAAAELSLVENRAVVRLTVRDLAPGGIAEIEHLLLVNNAVPIGEAFEIPLLGFRRMAVDLSRLLTRHTDEVRMDAGAQALLARQLQEIRARLAARDDARELTTDEVVTKVAMSGRFARQIGRAHV